MLLSRHKKMVIIVALSMVLLGLFALMSKNSTGMNLTKPKDLRSSNTTHFLKANSLNLFLKQLSRAQRFERSQELSDVIGQLSTRLSRIGGGNSTMKNKRKHLTVIFNAVNEITNLRVLLDDINNGPAWAKSTTIQLGLTRSVLDKYSTLIRKIQLKLPNFKTTILNYAPLVQTLTTLVEKCSTKYVMLTKKNSQI